MLPSLTTMTHVSYPCSTSPLSLQSRNADNFIRTVFATALSVPACAARRAPDLILERQPVAASNITPRAHGAATMASERGEAGGDTPVAPERAPPRTRSCAARPSPVDWTEALHGPHAAADAPRAAMRRVRAQILLRCVLCAPVLSEGLPARRCVRAPASP